MFMAVMRDYADVFEKLLEIPDSAHVGPNGWNALHAAVRNGNSGEKCVLSGGTKKFSVFFTISWLLHVFTAFVCSHR